MERICKYCKEEKPIEEFGKNKHGRYGYLWKCKKCVNKYSVNYNHIRYGRKTRIAPIKILIGIYKIQSKLFPDKIYIGASKNIIYRWRTHKEDLLRNRYKNHYLQDHANKYGFNDLLFSVIKICKSEHLVYWEQYYISELNPFFNTFRFSSELNSNSNEARDYAFQDMVGATLYFSLELQLLSLNIDFKEELIPFNIL
jgi:hypothetical protein